MKASSTLLLCSIIHAASRLTTSALSLGSGSKQQHLLASSGTPGEDGGVRPATTTLVDLLSSDRDFSLFVRLLQRARLIPTLNRFKNATLFAPVDEALRSDEVVMQYLDSLDTDEEESELEDNLQYRLRERLFYHMLNYSLDVTALPVSDSSSQGSLSATAARGRSYQTTLLYPTTHEEHGRPGHVPYPAPGSPDTLLGGEGQKLVLQCQADSGFSNPNGTFPNIRVGVDEQGRGGGRLLPKKGGLARNGRLYAIDRVLDPPKSLAHQVRRRANVSDPSFPSEEASLARFSSLLTPDIWKSLLEQSHLTLFAPKDEAFEALHELEWRYLNSGFAADDILNIANNHRSGWNDQPGERVGYLDRLVNGNTVPLLSGDSASITRDDIGAVSVNGSAISTADVLASNGVLHIIDSLLLPHGSLALTPEKYLLALNATRFVSLFREAELSHLLRSSPHNPDCNASYTILAVKDDVLQRADALPWSTLPPNGTRELADTLKYHVLPGKWSKKDLRDGMLLKTMLGSAELGYRQQRIAVSVSHAKDDDDSDVVSSIARGKRARRPKRGDNGDDDTDIGFGNANVIAEPIQAGNSIIYLISRTLETPSSLISTALDKGLSTFVAAIYSAGLDRKLLHDSPGTTFLAPTNAAFEYLGLSLNYLLLPSAQPELAQVLRYHALNDTIYLDEMAYDSQHYQSLEGSDIYLERKKNATHIHVRGPRIGGFPANGDNRAARITEQDLLTRTGVLHVIDQVELPPTVNITSQKLMRGAKASTFPDLLKMANLSWIAEGKPSPANFFDGYPFIGLSKSDRSRIRKKFFAHDSYTILCPTDKAFTRLNLTHYLNDIPSLLALVQLHIIPSPPPSKSSIQDPMRFPSDGRPLLLGDETSFSTLLSKSQGGSSKYGDVAFRKAGESDWLVGIKGARYTSGKHDAARLIGFGRNTPIFRDDGDGENDTVSAGDTVSAQRKPKMVLGGGVLLIDGVLEPFEASWFQRWGYIVVIVIVALAASSFIAICGWKLWEKRKRQGAEYEALRQDNEED